jgi:hypothetical protein
MLALITFAVGVILGAVGYNLTMVNTPGKPVGPYEQAVVRRGGQFVAINGPAWLSLINVFNLVDIFDVTDKRLTVHVEPAYAQLPDPQPGGPTRQRFYVDITIVYRPIDMVRVLRMGEDVDGWITSHVVSAVRAYALTQVWNEFDNGSGYATAALNRLHGLDPEEELGIQIRELYVERVTVRTPGEMQAIARGNTARTLGREGLVLAYLDTLQEMAASPSTTILIPTQLPSGPDPDEFPGSP